jgi:hypothetical protein
MSSVMNQRAILSPTHVLVSTPAKASHVEKRQHQWNPLPTTRTRARTFSKMGECLAESIFKKSVYGVQSYQQGSDFFHGSQASRRPRPESSRALLS